MTALEIMLSNIRHERTHPNMWFELRAEYAMKDIEHQAITEAINNFAIEEKL